MMGSRTGLSWSVIALLTLAIQAVRAEIWTTNFFSTTSAAMSADGRVQVASGSGTLVSCDYGATWSSNAFAGAAAVSANGSNIIVAGAPNVWISTDSGTNWVSYPAPSPTISAQHIACSADASRVGMVLFGGNRIFISTNGGAAWTTNNDAPSAAWSSISSSASGQRLVACIQNMGVWLSTNYGVNWSSILATNDLWGVACSADARTIIATGNMVYLSSDSGTTWSLQHPYAFGGRGAACSADGTRLGAVSYTGISISANSGLTWTNESGAGTVLGAIATSADGHRWMTGHSGQGRLYLGTSTPDPALSVVPTNGNVTIFWTVPSSPFVLQERASLNATSWAAVTDPPNFNLNTLQNEILIPATNSGAFFRLSGP